MHRQVDLYIELLEQRYGKRFDIAILSNDELTILEALAQHAWQQGQHGTTDEAPLLAHIQAQRRCRDRYSWLPSYQCA